MKRRAATLLASAFAVGAVFAAAPAHASVGPDSVRITGDGSDSVRITGDGSDSVRITGGCEGANREHIMCRRP